MKFILMKPTRADIKAQFSLIKPAFNGVHCAKAEYEFCCESVNNKQASFYHLKGNGVSVRFVGLVNSDNEYLILAMTGKGLIKAAPYIIEAVKSQGYKAIKYHTVRAGMARVLKSFGFVVTGKTEHDSTLTLTLEEC